MRIGSSNGNGAGGSQYQAPSRIPRFAVEMPVGDPRALILVAHGLNLHPDRMMPVCGVLRDSGAAVVRMALRGHRGSYRELAAVTRSAWLDDFTDACSEIDRIRSQGPGHAPLPVGFVGQSIGALTFADHLLQIERVAPFTAAVFLSPAVALRPKAQLMRASRFLPRGLPIPSASAREDRLYGRLPAGVYRALFESYAAVRRTLREGPVRLQTTILSDPDDELVSFCGLQQIIGEGGFPNARLVGLEYTKEARGYGHMAVDEPTMGAANWKTTRGHLRQLVESISGSRVDLR